MRGGGGGGGGAGQRKGFLFESTHVLEHIKKILEYINATLTPQTQKSMSQRRKFTPRDGASVDVPEGVLFVGRGEGTLEQGGNVIHIPRGQTVMSYEPITPIRPPKKRQLATTWMMADFLAAKRVRLDVQDNDARVIGRIIYDTTSK